MIKLYMEIYTLFSIEVIQLDNHNENNTEWIIAGNPDKYDVVGAFRELGTIDWTQSSILMLEISYTYTFQIQFALYGLNVK